MTAFIVRVPDHLGDGVLALPAVTALARRAPTRVIGPGWAADLYRGLGLAADVEPTTAILLKPSFRAAWALRHIRRRVGVRWDARGPLLTDAVVRPPGHRLDEYAAICRVAGVRVHGLPTYRADDIDGVPELARGAVLLLPGSASGAVVQWPRFSELAQRLVDHGLRPVFAGGPAEAGWIDRVAGSFPVLPALSIPHFGAAAAAARAVVGNDSGLSHLAAAARRGAGLAEGGVHVVFGSTDPAQTGAPGARVHKVDRPPPCWPCYAKRCSIGVPCLDIDVSSVLATLRTEAIRTEADR